MTTFLRSAQSLEYVEASVAVTDVSTGDTVDPTTDPVSIAFLTSGDVVDVNTTFVAGSWVTNVADPTAPVYIARVLTGPTGAYVPVAGTRIDVHVRVTDNPEAPVIRGGSIRFR